MEELFKDILDKDEKIVKAFKPNKKRYVFISILESFIFTLISLGIIIGTSTIMLFTDKSLLVQFYTIIGLALGIGFVGLIIKIVALCIEYKNTVYAYSNKRLIIRSGFIGVDYKSLDLKSISAINVKVDFLDKLAKDTGTIYFGAMSSPMNNSEVFFKFIDISEPMHFYREIKEHIENTQQEKDK